MNFLIRCSALGRLMTDAVSIDPALRTPEVQAIIDSRKRTDEEKAILERLKAQTLSESAKTLVRELVAQELFGVDFEISSKQMEKGKEVEQDAIDLLNRVRGLELIKNDERRSNDFITGECDLFDKERRRGHDVKSPWSLASFPITEEACIDRGYEWQMRGYMALWDASEWEVNYCMVDTPERLIGPFEPMALHFVSQLPEHMRLTTWVVKRDPAIEQSMWIKVRAAQKFAQEVIATFDRTHQHQ